MEKYVNSLQDKGYTEAELGVLVRFVGIKQRLDEYANERGQLPISLLDLDLPAESITDDQGQYFKIGKSVE